MEDKKLTDELRVKLNEYLERHYGMQIPQNEDCIFEDRRDYIYINDDSENFIYIPKNEIK
jgi:hypothetical protein